MDIEKMIIKAKLAGRLQEINTFHQRRPLYIISISEYKHNIIIPDNVEILDDSINNIQFNQRICKLKGELKLIGGRGLLSLSNLLRRSTARVIDLSEFKPIKSDRMDSMLCECKLDKLILNGFDTSNIEYVHCAFEKIEIDDLDLTVLNLSKANDFSYVFYSSKINRLNLSGMDLSNLSDADSAFKKCSIKQLDLNNIDIKNLKIIDSIFMKSKINYLNLNNIKVSSSIGNSDLDMYCFYDSDIDNMVINREYLDSRQDLFLEFKGNII